MNKPNQNPPAPPEPQNPKEIDHTQTGIGCIVIILFGLFCMGIGMLILKYFLP